MGQDRRTTKLPYAGHSNMKICPELGKSIAKEVAVGAVTGVLSGPLGVGIGGGSGSGRGHVLPHDTGGNKSRPDTQNDPPTGSLTATAGPAALYPTLLNRPSKPRIVS